MPKDGKIVEPLKMSKPIAPSDLDDFFGPKRHRDTATVAQKRTGFPKAPEHLRGILDKWEELHGYGKVPKKQLVNSAHRYYEACGGAVSLVARTYEYMKGKGLFRKDLGSLITIALDFKDTPDKNSDEYREQYVKGWTFDE